MSDTPLRTTTLLSVVAPVYDEEELVEEFVARASAAVADYDFELILVNDGSSDRTPELLDRIAATDPRVRVIHLSRNFGHQAALTAGLEHAVGRRRGDDRRRPAGPAGADPRDGRPVEPGRRRRLRGAQAARGRDRLQARHRLAGSTSCSTSSPRSTSSPTPATSACSTAGALDALLSMTERSRFLRGMTVWVGFTQTAVSYQRDARHAGETKYTLRKMLRFSLDAIASFSHLPLQLATYVGLLSAGVAFIAIPVVDRAAPRRLLPAGLRLDHDRDPAARRHPADRARRDRRVRRADLRRGQAPAAVHRARGAQPPERRHGRTGRRRRRRPRAEPRGARRRARRAAPTPASALSLRGCGA